MSIYSRFRESAQKYPQRKALAWKESGDWHFFSYKTLLQKVDAVAANLQGQIKSKDRVIILSENRPEWTIADLALNKLSAVSVPIHAVSSHEYIQYVLEHSESTLVIASQALYIRNQGILEGASLPVVSIASKDFSLKNQHRLFSDLCTSKDSKKSGDLLGGTEDDLASIVYTSGTTGRPKGVMLSNKNFLSDVDAIGKSVPTYPEDVFLSILPLSHVLERTVGSYIPLLGGSSVVFNDDIKNLGKNLEQTHPTIIIAVPKIFERVYEKVFTQVQKKSNLQKNIFYWALKQSLGKSKLGYRVADILVYRKLRSKFGGHLRLAVSGGASIQGRILKFFSRIGLTIIEGYGLTETSPTVTTNTPKHNMFGTVGRPLPGMRIKIDKDKEILIKGPNVMRGYWKQEDATQKVLSENGWFRTGDLGFLDQENNLTVIGRKKDIIITTNGENIAPEKIEMEFNLSEYIEQSLLIGNKRKNLSILIVPSMEAILQKYGKDADVHSILTQEVQSINKKFPHREQPKGFLCIETPFSIENEELTPTLKVKRKTIESHYEEEIEKLYKDFEKST